jgi:hypothetical protein
MDATGPRLPVWIRCAVHRRPPRGTLGGIGRWATRVLDECPDCRRTTARRGPITAPRESGQPGPV